MVAVVHRNDGNAQLAAQSLVDPPDRTLLGGRAGAPEVRYITQQVPALLFQLLYESIHRTEFRL